MLCQARPFNTAPNTTKRYACSKDARLPMQLQRAMAAEAEAAREARAKVIRNQTNNGESGSLYSR